MELLSLQSQNVSGQDNLICVKFNWLFYLRTHAKSIGIQTTKIFCSVLVRSLHVRIVEPDAKNLVDGFLRVAGKNRVCHDQEVS
jgi:hypothetical protein